MICFSWIYRFLNGLPRRLREGKEAWFAGLLGLSSIIISLPFLFLPFNSSQKEEPEVTFPFVYF